MTPVRCSYAGCTRLGEHFEPDGRWHFCAPHYGEHLALRRDDLAAERAARLVRTRLAIGLLHDKGHTDREIGEELRIPAPQVKEHRKALGLPANTRKARTATCGTAAGYVAHRSRQEQPCAPCITARREYDAARYRRRKSA